MPYFKSMPMPPSQLMLFGRSVEEAVPVDSDVRVFSDVMECFDYSGLESKCSERGCPPYPPRVMVKVLGYAYSKGIRSSRRIESLVNVDVRFMWLAGGLKPDHNTLSRFRKENWRELEGLFKDSVRVCCEAGLVLLNTIAVDGTKIAAAASKRRIYDQARLDRQLAGVERILQEAEEADRAEDELYGSGNGNELPEDLRDAKARKARLEQIAERLKQSKKKAVVETDPDARVMWTTDGRSAGYNLQASVDSHKQVIVAMELTQAENDHGLLPEMVTKVGSSTGLLPGVSLADCGYADEGTLLWADESGHNVVMPLQEQPQGAARNDLFCSRCFLPNEERDVLVCPAGRELVFNGIYKMGSGRYRQYSATGCRSCSFRSQCVGKGKSNRRVSISVVAKQRNAMRERLASADGRALYNLRREIVEPVFGQIKGNQGFDRFICWGKEGATAESALMCMAHNVAKCAASAAARGSMAASIAAIALLRRATGLFGWIRQLHRSHQHRCSCAGF